MYGGSGISPSSLELADPVGVELDDERVTGGRAPVDRQHGAAVGCVEHLAGDHAATGTDQGLPRAPDRRTAGRGA